MTPVLAAFDGFFTEPEMIRDILLSSKHETIVNPVDGVEYPGICELGAATKTLIKIQIQDILKQGIKVNYAFSRLTTPITGHGPNKIHSDRTMGQYSAHIYMSRLWPYGAGTSIWQYKPMNLAMDPGELTPDEAVIVNADSADLTKWVHAWGCQGHFNRIFIHNACLWHLAEPIGGFGRDINDGRLVITVFFDMEAT